VNVLVVNWQDRENPHAGGAEIHLFEIFGRLAARGHRVRLICSGWESAPPRATLDGIEVERNILRLGILELRRGDVPPKVAIDEAVRLAHWFGGARAPGFVNGVLDGIARALGRL